MPIASNSVRRARPLLGTFVEVEVGGASDVEMDAAIEKAFDAVAHVHRLMSFHQPDSDVSRLNAKASTCPVRVHPWTFRLLESAIDLHRRSAGRFDIAVAPVLQDLGLLPRAQIEPCPPTPGSITSDAIELLPGGYVRFTCPGTRIDLGGIAKGFAVDEAICVLRRSGIRCALVNAGGDLAAFGPNSYAIDIRDPQDASSLLCRLSLRNAALATSGSCFDLCQSTVGSCSTIIDPRSGKCAAAVRGVTVRADSCMLADALTKVMMVAGPAAADLLEYYHANALMVMPDGLVTMTRELESAVCIAA